MKSPNDCRRALVQLGTWLVAGLLALLFVSCGGGTVVAENGGVGSGGTGISSGTVTGFGSVVVDGTAYSSQTPLYYADSALAPASHSDSTAVQLGAQLQVQFDAHGAPTAMVVTPALVGAVASLGNNSLSINGVTVYTNTNPGAGPVTYYAGLTDFDDLSTGMVLEVHGSLGLNAQGAAYVQATLIRQLPATNTITRVSGVIANLGGSANTSTFTLGGVSVQVNTAGNAAASVRPSGTPLANGQWVNVWSNQPWLNAVTVVATQVQIQTLAGVSGPVQLGGVVSQLSGTRFVLNGITIDASAASLAGTLQTLAAGSYVLVQGQSDGSTNILHATSITSTATHPTQVSLEGTVTAYVSAGNFLVRGVPVNASAAQFAGGTSADLANGSYVQITGNVGAAPANLVNASSVTILPAPPSGGTVTYQGTISQVNANAGSFTLTLQDPDGGPATLPVSLSASVAYANGSAAQLVNGANAQIEAASVGAGLLAYTVTFNNGESGQTVNGLPVLGTYGLAYSVGASSFVINGLTIQMNGVSVTNGPLLNGSELDVGFIQSAGQNLAVSISVDQ